MVRIIAPAAASVELLRGLDRLHELFRGKGLPKVSHATGAQRGAARRVLIASGDEYDWWRNPRLVQSAFKLDARRPIQVDIQHEAARHARISTLGEGLDSGEGLNVEPAQLEKPLDSSQDAGVIVEDVDELARDHHTRLLPLPVSRYTIAAASAGC
jgi:hypothetical protein